MSNRFIHHSFETLVPCAHCGGELEVHVEGHYNREEFAADIVTNRYSGRELPLNDFQRTIIEARGDDQFPMAQQELVEHRREQNREMQLEARS